MQVKTHFELEFSEIKTDNEGAVAIIVAAGSGNRMMGVNKIFAGLLGVPTIARTLRAFEKNPNIKKIVIVTKEEDINKMQLVAENYLITKVSDIVAGGKTRFGSVMNGIKVLSESDTCILVHDGARPFVTQRIINDVYNATKKHGAAICAVALKDTVKFAGDGNFVESTPDRTKMRAVQTPQGFMKDIYLECVNSTERTDFTDDSSVIEAGGRKVYIVEGDYNNIKITTPEDLNLAEAILRNEGNVL